LLMETGRYLNLTARGLTFRACFLGFKQPEYLVVEVPRSAEIEAALSDSQAIIGSFLTLGKMVRFKSSIVCFLKKPVWLLFVAYPPSVENTYNLRRLPRVDCSIPCVLVTLSNLKKYSGSIVNLNAGGCKCIVGSVSPGQARIFNSEKLLLEFELSGGSNRKRLFGDVMNVERDGDGVSLGVKFSGNDKVVIKELSEYFLDMVNSLST